MDGQALGFVSLGLLIVIQLGLFAYGYGKLKQKVDDLCNRIIKAEDNIEETRQTVGKLKGEVALLCERQNK